MQTHLTTLRTAALFALLATSIGGAICYFRPPPSPTTLDGLPSFYFEMAAYLRSVSGQLPDGSSFFIGDSHIQNLCVPCVVPGAVNLGIGHDTTVGLLNRLPDYPSLPRASQVVIAIGSNDLKRRDNTKLLENYQKILAALPHNTKIYWLAQFPVDARLEQVHHRTNRRIQQLNQLSTLLCLQRPGCQPIDPGSLLTDNSENLRSEYHRGDGLHLNNLGYQRLIEILREHINPTNH